MFNNDITHIYGKDFLNHIQQPISVGEVTMKPVVLRASYEYKDESKVQDNSIESYIEYKDVCIISLRDEKDNRVTNEFAPQGDKKIMTNIKSRGRFNSPVTEDLQPFVNILNLKMRESSINNLYIKNQLVKECGLTGMLKEVEQIGKFSYRKDV